jgi:hypothetical protein
MEVSGQFNAPEALPPVPIRSEAGGGGRVCLHAVAKREFLYYPCLEFNPGRPVRSLVTTLTKLLRLESR